MRKRLQDEEWPEYQKLRAPNSGASNRNPAIGCSAAQLVEHPLHLTEGVAVAVARGAGNPGFQAADRIAGAASPGERLRGHVVTGCVLRVIGEQLIEFL